jgi:hypothetical protein
LSSNQYCPVSLEFQPVLWSSFEVPTHIGLCL